MKKLRIQRLCLRRTTEDNRGSVVKEEGARTSKQII